MAIKIDLDCKPSNQKEFLRHRSAVLASTKVYGDYLTARKVIIGIEPEMYVEQWIKCSMVSCDRNFEDLILIYFLKILRASQNNGS